MWVLVPQSGCQCHGVGVSAMMWVPVPWCACQSHSVGASIMVQVPVPPRGPQCPVCVSQCGGTRHPTIVPPFEIGVSWRVCPGSPALVLPSQKITQHGDSTSTCPRPQPDEGLLPSPPSLETHQGRARTHWSPVVPSGWTSQWSFPHGAATPTDSRWYKGMWIIPGLEFGANHSKTGSAHDSPANVPGLRTVPPVLSGCPQRPEASVRAQR